MNPSSSSTAGTSSSYGTSSSMSGEPTSIPAGFTPDLVSGNIAGTSAMPRPILDTLDEPVSATLLRDARNIWAKLKQVLIPQTGNKNILRDWDWWGPLLLCLVLAIRLGLTAPDAQSTLVFTGVFVIVWCGAAVVTLNGKLLGGKLSFFQSVCVLGYCIFPLVIASLLSWILPSFIIKIIVVSVAFAWSTFASVGFLAEVQLTKRRTLAVYPIFLFYFIISWMILIS